MSLYRLGLQYTIVEFKYPQDSRFRLRTTQWKISDKNLIDAGPSNANINLEQKFGNVKKYHQLIIQILEITLRQRQGNGTFIFV
jgi:hypothetical protein